MFPTHPREFKRKPRTPKRDSRKSERVVAELLRGRPRPASGAIPGIKGDVKSDTYLVEDKFTDKKSYLVSLKTLNKIAYEALGEGRVPALSVWFRKAGRRFWLVPLTEFVEHYSDEYELFYLSAGNSFPLSVLVYERVASQSQGQKRVAVVIQFDRENQIQWVLREL